MDLGEKISMYQKTYRDYLMRISERDFPRTAKMRGLLLDSEGLLIPLFGAPYRVTKKDIRIARGNPFHHSDCGIFL